MPQLIGVPPFTPTEPVTEFLHGVTVTDPYRWLEDQESPRTREWLAEQKRYARSILGSLPGRVQIRARIRELLDVETHDSVQLAGGRYFFRKRKQGQEQFAIYFRDGIAGADQLLIDPERRGTGPYTAVKPLRVSPDGQLLLYEVKEGGERTARFEILDIVSGKILDDALPRGYLRGLVFSPDSRSFYYSHEPLSSDHLPHRAVYLHTLGTDFSEDREVFVAGEDVNLRLGLISNSSQMGILLHRFSDTTLTDFYLCELEGPLEPTPVVKQAQFKFAPWMCEDRRVLAITNDGAPNYKIVEACPQDRDEPEFVDLVPETKWPIQGWMVTANSILVQYFSDLKNAVEIFDLRGTPVGQMPIDGNHTVRLLGGTESNSEVLFEEESFTRPVQVNIFSPQCGNVTPLAKKSLPFDSDRFDSTRVWFAAKDGTPIPMSLVGRTDVLECKRVPTIMTSYGGYGVSMTPRFSVMVALLMERGCLFALPSIRGGSEFGVTWHEAARRLKRQVAIDDFLSAADWLIESRRAAEDRLAIFGGSNSGLLVAAALTQRPHLFKAALCMVPMTDMVRYHLFDNAQVWKEEFGTTESSADFAALLSYSPYHNVNDSTAYPATMFVSGDADRNCNPLHARKMTARLQAANTGNQPIFLDYSRHRGHAPVLPLTHRINALTDRLAFLCDRLNLSV